MSTFLKFPNFALNLLNGSVNLGPNGTVDGLSIMLTNTNTNFATVGSGSVNVYGDINGQEITGGGSTGYTTGGEAVTISSSTIPTSGTYSGVAVIVAAPNNAGNATWQASTSGMGPFRYVVLYSLATHNTLVKPLIGYWDYGSSLSLTNGQTFTVTMNNLSAGGVLQLS